MPLYEYLCTSCGHRFERIRKFSDPPLTECPSCHGVVEKQFSSPAIQFKGSGWYINDYAKAGKSEAKTESKGKDSGSAESKPDKPSTDSTAEKSTSTETAPKSPTPAPTTDKS